MLRERTPLAWRNVTENKLRLFASIAGTAFAVVLMFMETGFKQALLNGQVALLDKLNCDIVLVSPSRAILAVPQPFPYRRLQQALAVPEVKSAVPFYIEADQARWRSTTDHIPRRIRVLAFRLEDNVFEIPEVRDQLDKLKRPDTALADWRSKKIFYGPFTNLPESELAGREIQIVGTFGLGADFQNNGNLIMSEENFFSLLPQRASDSLGASGVDLGLVKLAPGANADSVRKCLDELLPEDVLVLTKADFMLRERDFWNSVTPVGIIFNIGVVMGFIVGVTICYQVLFSDISDRLSEFATLRAIGYSTRRLFVVVLEEALILAVLGYVIGLMVSAVLYWAVGSITGLPLVLQWQSSLFLFVLTALMCIVSGCIAVRKLFAADPAELFR
ncbi:MAG: ABC transporter permease DevC [Planctomycetota bacterium]